MSPKTWLGFTRLTQLRHLTEPLKKALSSLSKLQLTSPDKKCCGGLAVTTEGTAASGAGRVTCPYKLAEVVATAALE